MDRNPVFHQNDHKAKSIDFMRNTWCPYYEICLNEAAFKDIHFDCGACVHCAAGTIVESMERLRPEA